MKKIIALALAALLACLAAAALADGANGWLDSKLNGSNSVRFSSYEGGHDGWVDADGRGGVTIPESTTVRVISHNASVWAQPRTNSEKLGTVKNGEELSGRIDGNDRIIVQDGFFAVEYKGKSAWVNCAYAVCGPYEIVLMESNVPAYCAPDRNAKRVGSLSKLTRYTVIGFYGDYYVVNLREASAFIPRSVRHYDTIFEKNYHAAWNGQGKTTSKTTVRTGPGSDYPSVRDMSAGSSFTYWDVIDGWCLTVDGDTGCFVYIDASDTDI